MYRVLSLVWLGFGARMVLFVDLPFVFVLLMTMHEEGCCLFVFGTESWQSLTKHHLVAFLSNHNH